MFDNKDMLYEIALDHPVHNCLLPDRFMLDSTRDRLWASLLGGKNAIRELGERLRKSEHIEMTSRETRRRMSDESIITMLMLSHESRIVLMQAGTISPEEWHDMVFSAQGKALSGKPKKPKAWALKLESYDFDLTRESVEKVMLDLIQPYTDLEFYRGLGQTEKDSADFVINAALCNLMSIDISFVLAFIEHYTFLMERQTAFVMGVTRAAKEGGTAGKSYSLLSPPTEVSYPDYWRACLRTLFDGMPDKGQDITFTGLIRNANILLSLTSHGTHGIGAALRDRLDRDEQRLFNGLSRLQAEVEQSGLQVEQEAWKNAVETLASLPKIPAFPALSKSLLAELERYVNDRSNLREQAERSPKLFTDPLHEVKRIKVAITEEISKPNTDVNKLGELTGQLSEQTALFQESAAQLGAMYAGVLQIGLNLREKLVEFADGVEAQPTPEVPAEPEVQAYPDLREDLKQAKQEALTLAEKLTVQEKLNQSNSTVIENLTTELSEYRGNVHKLKQRLTFIPKAPEEPEVTTPLPFDLFKKIIIGAQPNPLEILSFFELEAPDRVVVLPSAKVSADEANDYRNGHRLAELVQRLLYPYFDAIQSGEADATARKILGNNNYAAKESQGVEQNRSLRSQREFEYNGETYYFQRHLSLGRNYGTADSIRLYFEIIEGKVVIAYCGKHLDSVQTN